jgi:hypothetical protein
MRKLGIIKQCLDFLVEERKFWLLPIFVVLILLGALLLFAKGSALAPFIYSLF